jgi:hypothetical protein
MKTKKLLYIGCLMAASLVTFSSCGRLQCNTYLLAELKNRLKISIFLWRKSCASR